MNEGIYGGTLFQEEGSESIEDNSGAITLPDNDNLYDVFIAVTGGDVFETSTEDGAGGAKAADGATYIPVGRYRGGSVIQFRCGAGLSSVVTYTAKLIVG